jgi:hypothetical protein
MIYKFSFYLGELYIAELINEHMDLQEERLTVGRLIRQSVLSPPTVGAVSRAVRRSLSVLFLQQR